MENGQVVLPRRRTRTGDYRELATRGSYTVIFVMLGLLALRPLMVDQMVSRAEAYSAFGMLEQSRRQCNKALLLDSDNSRAWYQLARIHRAQNRRESAYVAYQRAAQADAANKPAHFELGLMYADDDLYQQAIPYFDQVRKLGPDDPQHLHQGGFAYHKASLDMLALCYEKAGDITKAEFTLEEIRVCYPNYASEDTRLAELKQRHK
jgi:tetratricopeptide (TPR) repeat protein